MLLLFFSNLPTSTEIYPLSLHDALPISSIIFSTKKDKPGGLYEVLGEFATRRINLTRIESRPTKVVLGEYLSGDRKSTRLNSSHVEISYAVFCLKKKRYEPDDDLHCDCR